MGPVAASAISSIGQIDMVLAVKMTPFRPAARAATASPRGQNMPVKPGGREDERRRDRNAEDGGRLVPAAHVHQRPRPEPVAPEVRLVVAAG